MKITRITSSMVSVPYTTPTTWSLGRGVRTFNLIIRVETDAGIVGWGESVGPSVHNARNMLERDFAPLLIGEDPLNLARISQKVALALDYLPGGPWAYSGLEMALWDIKGKALEASVSDLLGGRLRDAIDYIGYVFIDEPEVNVRQAKEFVEAGHTTIKMKIGRDIDTDVERVRAVRDVVGPSIKIRVDPNTAWTRTTALANIERLAPYNLEFVEQPLPRWDLDGMAELRARSPVPIGADESCGTFRDALALIRAGACDVLVVYVSQAGGIAEAKRIGDLAADEGLICVMGSASELALATLAQAHVLANSPGFVGAADTHYYLEAGDVTEERLVIQNGHLQLPCAPGLGATVSVDRVKEFPVPEHIHSYSLYDE